MSEGPPPVRKRPQPSAPPRRSGSRGDGADAPSAPPPVRRPVAEVKLVCGAGPCAGQEFPLSTDEVTIGRAAEVELSIPDTSVSRKHTKLTRGIAGWNIQDLGSGNGTLLNGERVEDEVPLRNGDVVTLGDTALTFVDMANSTDRASIPPRPSNGGGLVRRSGGGRSGSRPRVTRAGVSMLSPQELARKSRTRRMVMLAAAVVLLVLIGVKTVLDANGQRQEAAQHRVETEAQQLGELFQGGVQLVREGKWKEAEAKFLAVRAGQADYPGVGEYLERAAKERPNQVALEAAQSAVRENRFGDAQENLKRVASDTTLFKQLADTRVLLEARLPTRVAEARNALEQKRYQSALDISEDLLKGYPDNRDAKVIAEQAAQMLNQPRKGVSLPSPTVAVAVPWEPAVKHFIDGDLSGAVAMANGCVAKAAHCKDLLRQMAEFGELQKRVEDLDQRGLRRMLDLSNSITNGRGSKLAGSAQTRGAGNFYKTAATAYAAKQWGKAAEFARMTTKADPNNSAAKAMLDELKGKAKEIYLYAYQQEREAPEDALQKYKDVLAMTGPDDEYHSKAQKKITALTSGAQ